MFCISLLVRFFFNMSLHLPSARKYHNMLNLFGIEIKIGATLVGSIELVVKEGQQIQRGDEIGFFKFGGSTILVLFPIKSVSFDRDLLRNTHNALETLIKMGDSIGRYDKNPSTSTSSW